MKSLNEYLTEIINKQEFNGAAEALEEMINAYSKKHDTEKNTVQKIINETKAVKNQ